MYMKNPDKYVGITNAAKALGVSVPAIRSRLRSGEVYGHTMLDGHHYFDTDLLTREIWGIRNYRRSVQ